MYYVHKIQQLARSKRLAALIVVIFTCQVIPVSLASPAEIGNQAPVQLEQMNSHCQETQANLAVDSGMQPHMMSDSGKMHQAEHKDNCCENCACYIGSCYSMLLGTLFFDGKNLTGIISPQIVNFYPSILLATPLRPPTII
jgi:hypothetical protein